jgi:hypothetical protein
MWKTLGTLALMVFSGVFALVVCIFILMSRGLRLHDNYEYYGDYAPLCVGVAVIAFIAPGVIVLYVRRLTAKTERRK